MTTNIPADVPADKVELFAKNYDTATHGVDRMMLFAGDQKIEHLNDDFGSKEASSEDADPEHLFQIAAKSRISCFAAQLGLIARYGRDYKDIPYVIKLNSKTNIVPVSDRDPLSEELYTIDEVLAFRETSGLNIVGIGYTLYLGSEYEAEMLKEASEAIFAAHEHGLFTILWIYPRGKNVPHERDPHIIAGATGVAVSLGSDFVKVNYPELEGSTDPIATAEAFVEAVKAAGRTKVICAGGGFADPKAFFEQLHNQIHISGASGNATGRNVHMRPLAEAIRFCNGIAAITFDNASAEEALRVFNEQ